ncbi:type III polyketide synthase [Paenibacillus oenotherae]|uniref:Type III polyketide synthase n=1 Tax=Paenibacillus oenotherae TaxID=1435645 RepID=A0ABS7DBV4_9BACL|nr:type III polyketide synthase [Paenibacillus oenotherae]MBW7477096.1 type III polyketide synthase [Paenibacillus oenotherae]
MEHADPTVAILGIGTAVPDCRIDQEDASQRLCEALEGDPHSIRWAKRIFRQSGVNTRYTCEPDLLAAITGCRYLPQETMEHIPATSERMSIYKRESVPLAFKAASSALYNSNITASDITHLITVSCTGQFLPGLDAVLVHQLGLAPHVNRIPLNFLGCAAGLKAICLGKGIVSRQHEANVLIVCVELCTLHIQPSIEKEALLAASFFGDGASACVIGTADDCHSGLLQLGDEHSVLLPDSAEEMVWEVGDYGFHLYLSPKIPKLLGELIPKEVSRLLHDGEKPDLWAIHPGGRGIIDTMQGIFGLTDEQARYSRHVLLHYGNLSSATLLFVLNEMLQELSQTASGGSSGIAIAFGPGLTAEMIRFHYVPSTRQQEQYSDRAYV